MRPDCRITGARETWIEGLVRRSVQAGAVAGSKNRNQGLRRQHRDAACGPKAGRAVATRGKGQRRRSQQQGRCGVLADESAIGKGCGLGLKGLLRPGCAAQAGGVKMAVNPVCRWHIAKGAAPGRPEGKVVAAAAQGAGAMSGGQGHRLVQKEQLCPGARRHDPAPDCTIGQRAGNPVRVPPARPAKLACRIMQDAAIARQRATHRHRQDRAIRHDPVLAGHTIMSLVAVSVSSG